MNLGFSKSNLQYVFCKINYLTLDRINSISQNITPFSMPLLPPTTTWFLHESQEKQRA